MSELYARLKKMRERKKFHDCLLNLQEASPLAFEEFLKTMCKECHVTKPVFFTEPERMYAAEGRRKLMMGILSLIGEDDPQHIINRMEKEQ